MASIAVIGFGSLLWDLESLAINVRGGWHMYVGPYFPLEFSLVSKKRLGALALVVDEENGAQCPTCVIESARHHLSDAISDLARRERAPLETIGFFDRSNGDRRAANPNRAEIVGKWLALTNYDSAIWTDGASNFLRVTGRPFSLSSAREHLIALDTRSTREAQRYLRNAPKRVDTPLRRASVDTNWWSARTGSQSAKYWNQ